MLTYVTLELFREGFMNKEYLEKLSLEELLKLKDDIEDRILELTKTKKEPVMLELYYDFGKGTGRAWVAEVDKKTKKILKFLDAESNVKEETYRGYKVFLINKDGYYLSNESGTRSKDKRNYFRVVNNQYIPE